ncbi:hypothetical protein ACFO25_03380 [Paenactinomyces guangxiensis]|uniref:Membrane protein YkvI n=1 Tax=Paenactinomyces guangxiensis TaxID=1490290 RepID=A0A7W2A7R4_9BACL|nr:hypothetical protein [Paenactinomyces guangxiensis]MBA4494806.1 hypothetical protein [Paenactinomyces guangxiensis]MBH8591889.1 hypothetical protein [Paenactinomyces guangxiensis]
MRDRWVLAIRVGFTYIGTVVGAGFASGQEILHFFTVFGKYSHWGIIICAGLFSWLGTRMMIMGNRLNARSYEEFNHYLFGERWGRWMTAFVGVILFGVTTAMMSGTGALFEEQIGLSFHVGVIFTAVVSYLVIIRGMEGILSVNSLVVPLMFLFTSLVAIHGWQSGDWSSNASMPPVAEDNHWFLSALTYVAFNLAMSQAVLVPLGGEVKDQATIRIGGWIGGIGLGLMLLASNFAMQLQLDELTDTEIPMAFIIQALGAGMKYFFLTVMWGEIITTLIGNVYGLAANLGQVIPLRPQTIMALIFIFGYLFSLIGFPTLVSYLYPFFGYCGMIVIGLLILRRIPGS